jgi:hypothetical protein
MSRITKSSHHGQSVCLVWAREHTIANTETMHQTLRDQQRASMTFAARRTTTVEGIDAAHSCSSRQTRWGRDSDTGDKIVLDEERK